MTWPGKVSFVRVEHHMSTAVTLAGCDIDEELADQFFDRIRQLEDLLSRFRPHSEICRFERGEVDIDNVDPVVRGVLIRCATLRSVSSGDFEYEPRRRTGDPRDPVLDVNAVAKGWIIEEAAIVLRMGGAEFTVNAGGDVATSLRRDGSRWRVGVQHPSDRTALLGVFDVRCGAVATSGAYERGHHIRGSAAPAFLSVTVVGPDLGEADGLSTAVYAAGQSPPPWWGEVEPDYGLLTMSSDNRLRWVPPTSGDDFVWEFPSDSGIHPTVVTPNNGGHPA